MWFNYYLEKAKHLSRFGGKEIVETLAENIVCDKSPSAGDTYITCLGVFERENL